MAKAENHFPGVTLLITHYNRSSSLERLLKAFDAISCSFEDIVVSDDASKPEHQQAMEEMRKRFPFRLITTPKNKGLANNLNKGQEAVTTPYTLYVQEDFIPKPAFIPKLKAALGFLNDDASLDMVRFYAYYEYAHLEPFKEGFSRMVYKPWSAKYDKIYFYSDHPHLRRSTFLNKFGRYVEGIKSDKAEYMMCLAFIQNKGTGLFYDDFKGLFDQVNSDNEPSTVQRNNWRQQSNNPFIRLARTLYRQIKYNYDLRFTRPH
ncbi:glycosyl transferase family 2 [Runella rosea]|uniref:Glycosyl transferase family 2 n=1 Tax=Runella rosea TaxID=2259595 RepID=A0A344TGP2_9BACT|nr:glycosyltransferase family 2 protein [Runella rosea]AXE17813.1 glycosyl transferase family 2 [Runella rosea]